MIDFPQMFEIVVITPLNHFAIIMHHYTILYTLRTCYIEATVCF